MEQWKDSGYLEWLDNFGGKFEDRHCGFVNGGRFEHCSHFGFEGDGGFEGWYFEEDMVLDMTWWRDGDWG